MKYLKLLVCTALTAVLFGCGGGGGSAGTSSSGSAGNSGAASVANLSISMDKASLTNSGSDVVQITVTALDVSNNPVPAATVKGAVDSGIFTPGGAVTDAKGNYVAAVSTGGDKSLRVITVTLAVNGLVKSVAIPVIAVPGTGDAAVASFSVQLDKPVLANTGSDAVVLTVYALDLTRNPVAGATVKVALDSGMVTPGGTVTDAAGKFVASIGIGADKSLRTITATVTVGGAVKTVAIPVNAGPASGDSSVDSFIYELDKPALSNVGGDAVVVTVTTLDKYKNPVSGASVKVAVDSGVVTPTATLTDASGKYTAKVQIGGDASLRTITASITVIGKTSTALIRVIGNAVDASVASFPIAVDKTTLSNSGSDLLTVTVVALDVYNNPVAGASIKGSVNSGILRPSAAVTDATGKWVATVDIGADKTNRNIIASITVNGILKTVTIPVVGSQIKLSTVPANPAPAQSVQLFAQLVDALGTGIAGTSVQLSGSAGFAGTYVTDAAGYVMQATSPPTQPSVLAPASDGSYDIIALVAAGTPLSVTKAIQVVSPGGSGIPDAVSLGVAQSLNANPTSIAPNANASTVNRARLSAKFLDASNGGIKNMRVRFEIVPPALGSGESISTGAALVYSDTAGLAESDYISGTRTSPTNGVQLRACYATTDAALANSACPQFVAASLTVNSQPLSISIGNYNKMTAGLGGVAYLETFLIQVADASGLAVRDAVVSGSVDITHYGKGTFGLGYLPIPVPDITVAYGAALYPGYISTLTPTASNNVWCMNEDLNRNGTMEVGEDINGTGMLEPRKSDIVMSYLNGNKTDANGQLLLQVSYPQNVGRWLAYTIKATTAVVGSEGTSQRSFVTNILDADKLNGSFLTPPYGSGNCVSPK